MNQNHAKLTPLVESLPATIPFVGPEAIERRHGGPFALQLGANESAFGVSPLAAEAMRQAIGRSAWYGDPEGYDLREAIAERHGVAMDEVRENAGRGADGSMHSGHSGAAAGKSPVCRGVRHGAQDAR